MTAPILAAGLVLIVVVVLLLVWHARRSGSVVDSIRRDAATVETEPRPRMRLGTRLGGVFRRPVDAAFWRELEDALIGADVGVAAAREVVAAAQASNPASADAAREVVSAELASSFGAADRTVASTGEPGIIVVVGVNGSGKTTTIAKLAASLRGAGESVLVAAADTYRAAAAEQVASWGERIGFDVVSGAEGADPAAVAFDGLSAARARGCGVLIVDTAGRLHAKQNLMDELSKIVRVLVSEAGSVGEILLVLDGSTGQNGIAQARAFTDAVGVTGIALTKLDGTAKGGVVIAVERELAIPVKLVGVGEGRDDLLHFDPVRFVSELLGDA